MAFEWFFAFDHLPSNGASSAIGEGALSSRSGGTLGTMGGRRAYLCTYLEYFERAVPPLTDIVVGMRTLTNGGTSGAGSPIVLRSDSGASILHLYRVFTDGTLELRQGSTVLGRASRKIDVQRYVELCVNLVGPGEDSATLRIDGNDELVVTGLSLGNSPVSTVRLGAAVYCNDLYVREAPADDSPFYGPLFLRWLPVQADVAVQWARNGGTSNAGRLIDPNGSDFDATYIETQTLGDLDEFTTEQLPAGVNSIIAVVPVCVSTAPSGGAPQVRMNLKTSAGTILGPERTVGVGGYRTQMAVHHEKPGGGGWSRAAVNELHLQIEAV